MITTFKNDKEIETRSLNFQKLKFNGRIKLLLNEVTRLIGRFRGQSVYQTLAFQVTIFNIGETNLLEQKILKKEN